MHSWTVTFILYTYIIIYISIQFTQCVLQFYVHTCWSYCRESSNVPFLKLVSTTLVNWGAATGESTDISARVFRVQYNYVVLYTHACTVKVATYCSMLHEFEKQAQYLSDVYLLLQELYISLVMSIWKGRMKEDTTMNRTNKTWFQYSIAVNERCPL